ncbi:MAG: HEAT repeat domain-containing protein [Phycisphaerae bacterium]|nr:HEAT repeat domain-containing protein [Phycisphaerae bacterium]
MRHRKQVKFIAIAVFVLITGQMGCQKSPTRREVRQNKRFEAMKKVLVSDGNLEERFVTAERLANMGVKAIGAADAIIQVMGNENDTEELRAHAVWALGKIFKSTEGPKPAVPDTVVSALEKALEDSSDLVRIRAVLSKARIFPDQEPEMEILLEMFDKSNDLKMEAARAASCMGARGKGAVPVLIRELKNSVVGYHAACALGKIGPDAKEAIPALTNVAGSGGPAGPAAREAIKLIRK